MKSKNMKKEEYNIIITGRHVYVTDAMKDYAREKLDKLEHFSNTSSDVSVVMDIQKLEHRVGIVLNSGYLKIKVHASSNDMYISIDKAVDRLQRKITKYKEKIQHHQAKSLSVVDMNVNVIRRSAIDTEIANKQIDEANRAALEEEYHRGRIVDQEQRPLKILTEEEAIMKMELSGDAFRLYRDEYTNKLRVIYRRQDEDYGIIEVE